MSMQADVNDDIEIKINTINYKGINYNKFQFLFIENEFYLGFQGGTRIKRKEYKEDKLAYEIDMENDLYFDDEERKRWKYKFKKEFIKLDRVIHKKYYKYQKQFKN